MTAASTISPASTGKLRSSVLVPSADTCVIVSVVGSDTVVDVSECRKSPSLMVATWLCESGDQAPIECGCVRA